MADGKRDLAAGRGARRRSTPYPPRPTSSTQGARQREKEKQGADGDSGLEAGMVKGDRERLKLPLKHNGELIDVRLALALLDDLRAMQQVHPKQFETLVAMAQGRSQDVSPEQIAALKAEGSALLFSSDGLRPAAVALLASALETRDNCYVLVQPFRLVSGQEKVLADAALDENERAVLDMVFPERPGRGGSSRS